MCPGGKLVNEQDSKSTRVDSSPSGNEPMTSPKQPLPLLGLVYFRYQSYPPTMLSILLRSLGNSKTGGVYVFLFSRN